jgi:hypothetical protein
MTGGADAKSQVPLAIESKLKQYKEEMSDINL